MERKYNNKINKAVSIKSGSLYVSNQSDKVESSLLSSVLKGGSFATSSQKLTVPCKNGNKNQLFKSHLLNFRGASKSSSSKVCISFGVINSLNRIKPCIGLTKVRKGSVMSFVPSYLPMKSQNAIGMKNLFKNTRHNLSKELVVLGNLRSGSKAHVQYSDKCGSLYVSTHSKSQLYRSHKLYLKKCLSYRSNG